MKSPNFYILNGEICRKLQNFSKFEISRQILEKIVVQLCENCLKDILISFHMRFIS